MSNHIVLAEPPEPDSPPHARPMTMAPNRAKTNQHGPKSHGTAAGPDGNGNQVIYFNDDNDNTVKLLSH
jgi:hypothetical protein